MLDFPVPIQHIGQDPVFAVHLQDTLATHGYLDPPSDGKWGPVSQWALAEFGKHNAVDQREELSEHFRDMLFGVKPAPGGPRTGDGWVLAVIARMTEMKHWICRHPDCWNIVYVEGVDMFGRPNDDAPNRFNDVRLVFQIKPDGSVVSHAWEATCEPGRKYTVAPQNPKGAARISFGQHKAWGVGLHPAAKKPGQHEALVQREALAVHRDLNKDFKRTGDLIDTGLFGVNQHWGYDLPVSDIGGASAGCLVGRTRAGHKEFMAIVKSDPRYKVSKGYMFMATVLDGTELAL